MTLHTRISILARLRASASAFGAFLCVALFTTLTAFGQAPGTGTVTGTVSNQNTRQNLRAAEVRIAGTTLMTLSEADGSFRIPNVPAGPQQVIITYTGLDTETRPVTVTAGGTVREVFALKSDVYQMSELVIAGDREGQAKAINDQKNADHMKSIVASDAFGDLIDSNAAELMKSLPGFAMNYAGEDATGFTMRGQSSTYSSITMDGTGIPNSGFGSRALNMRNVQVNNIESIEVNRAPNASQPANSMGGSVNLVTKSAFSLQGRRTRVDLGMNINTQLRKYSASYQGYGYTGHAQYPTLQISHSQVFNEQGEHPIGVTVSLLKGGRYRYNTQYSPSYTTSGTINAASAVNMQEASAGFRQDYFSAKFDYKLSDKTTLFINTYYQAGPQMHLFGLNHRVQITAGNQIINPDAANRIVSQPNATPVAAGSSTGSRFTKTTGHEVSDNQNYYVNVGGKSRFNELNLEYNAYTGRDYVRNPISGFTKGGTLTYDLTNVGFIADNVQSESVLRLTQTAGPSYKDIANYGRLAWSGTNSSQIDWKEGAKIDARQNFNFGFPLTVQTGAAIDVQKRAASRTGTGARYTFGSGPDGVFGNGDDVALPLAQFVDNNMPGRWNMKGFPSIDPGTFIDMTKLAAYVAANPTAATYDPVTDVTNAFGTEKNYKEEIDAGYLMGTARFGKLTVVPGVRWEKTIFEARGYVRRQATLPTGLTLQQQADATRLQYSPIQRKTQYDDFYPNLQARYNFTDSFIMRAAYTQTIGRPNFTSLIPGDTINDTAQTISRNNPNLDPFNADNYDITAEYYFNKSTGQLTASLFRKDIVNYFQNVSFILPGGANNGYEGQYEGYTVTEQRNIGDTTRTDGYELGYQQALRFLPSILKNITASASYTHVRATPPPGSLAPTGIFPDVYNLGLTYNDSRFRVDLRYNMRKKWLNSINNTTGEKTFFRDNDRLDLSFNYRATRKFTVYFDWRNMTDEEDLRIQGDDQRVNFHQTAGMSVNTGVRYEF